MISKPELSCMPVELLCCIPSPLDILEWERAVWPCIPSLRMRPVAFWSTACPFLSLSPFLSRSTISSSTCIHGRGGVRACLLGGSTPFARCMETTSWGLLLLVSHGTSWMRGNQWTPWWVVPCQVRAHAKLALPCHKSMIEAAWLYPACEATQTGELYPSESLKVRLHIGHVIEWVFLFNGFLLFLVLPQILKELTLWCREVVELEICSHEMVQILLPTCTPVVSEVVQRVICRSLSSTMLLGRVS